MHSTSLSVIHFFCLCENKDVFQHKVCKENKGEKTEELERCWKEIGRRNWQTGGYIPRHVLR